MKAFLMHKNRDFDLQQRSPSNEPALRQDLELDTLFDAMALGDKFLFDVAEKTVFSGLTSDVETIGYRQQILRDCLKNPSIVRYIYEIAVASIEKERKHYLGLFRYPGSVLPRSIDVLQMFVGMLKNLRNIADMHADQFESEGFRSFFAMLRRELGDDYFTDVQHHLKQLKFRYGVLISAELGKGNQGTHYVLRSLHYRKQGWAQRIFAKKPPAFTFSIHPRDESGSRALSELKDRGINLVANALAQSTDHILSFFNMVRTELAFYVGCLNLHEQLSQIGEPAAFPLPAHPGERRHSFEGLYDVCLALTMKQKIVGNDMTADHKDLVVITGANQGGKSTFLRSIGLAQLMMQCGMFVPAESFRANLCDALFTHYKREEDPTMKSGKLDEELSRMSAIVDHLTPNSMVLFNESFAATNEREGSEIARQIVSALLEKRIKAFYVTHLFEFANGLYSTERDSTLFTRAAREDDGVRTFKIIEGEPLQTSYGEDLYNRIFATRVN
jgi:DNA mismatch repair ATPase MutS